MIEIEVFPLKVGTLKLCCPNGDAGKLAKYLKEPENYTWKLQVIPNDIAQGVPEKK